MATFKTIIEAIKMLMTFIGWLQGTISDLKLKKAINERRKLRDVAIKEIDRKRRLQALRDLGK